jgi:hypothetical protein
MIVTHLVRLKRPSTRKHKQWLFDQQEYATCVNWCVEQLQNKQKLSSKIVPHQLKSAIKNEAIRRAKKAIADKREGRAKTIPTFKSNLPISVNNQNWDAIHKNGHWYIGFTSNLGKLYLPVYENCLSNKELQSLIFRCSILIPRIQVKRVTNVVMSKKRIATKTNLNAESVAIKIMLI